MIEFLKLFFIRIFNFFFIVRAIQMVSGYGGEFSAWRIPGRANPAKPLRYARPKVPHSVDVYDLSKDVLFVFFGQVAEKA